MSGEPGERSELVAPIPDSYVVPGTRLAAGEYPGSRPDTPPAVAEAKLGKFLDAGITAFVDLTDPADRLDDYAPALKRLAESRGIDITYERLTIRDMDVCDAPHMRRVLDEIDARLAEGRAVYVHCWGGIGRTGMTVASWLVRHGMRADDALTEVGRLFRTMSPAKVRNHGTRGSPQTEPQRQFVRGWPDHEKNGKHRA